MWVSAEKVEGEDSDVEDEGTVTEEKRNLELQG